MDSPRVIETSVVDRLTTIQAKHQRRETLDYFYCTCGKWRDDYNTHDRHVAEVIVAAEDLAVMVIPEPSERQGSQLRFGRDRMGEWPTAVDTDRGYVYFQDVDSGDDRSLRADSAVAYVQNILAAALAAKATKDVAPDE